ncbi:MAG: hypothetical protein KTR31_28285 [Myxococcales bacterium]|nr:hypothetical protein [Myxococcales bacterium]
MSKARASAHEALKSRDVATRAAAVRDLSACGSAEDVETLLGFAKTDKSPSVRLYAAAAAADVAMRTASTTTGAVREAWVAAATGVDPGQNPSLLMVLAAVPTQKVLDRLGRTLRDPRYDVRAGAATALRRMACARGNPPAVAQRLSTTFSEWLKAGRHPADAVQELVRIGGQAALALSEEAHTAAAGRGVAAVLDEARDRLQQREELPTYAGVWASFGGDVMQPEPEEPETWLVIDEAGEVVGPSTRSTVALDGRASIDGASARLVWATRPGSEGELLALQLPDRTFWQCSGKVLVQVGTAFQGPLEAEPAAARAMSRALEPVEGVVAKRMRARMLWRGGDASTASELLDELVSQKKPHADALWTLAQMRAEAEDVDGATAAVARALELAPKNCTWREEANSLARDLAERASK